MRLLNSVAIGFAPMASRVGYPDHSLTLIAKLMLKLRHQQPCEILASPEPFFPSADVSYGDDEEARGGFRYESDYVPFKPGGDALLVGHFWAPGGRAVRLSEAVFSVGDRSLRVAVVGRRIWDGSRRWPTLESAEPFTSLELRWENAFGGPAFATNPIGKGFVPAKGTGPIELPRLERPENPYIAADKPPDPVCFAPIRRDWYLRRALLGTFDKRWKSTRWPWFPEDFDWRHFHAAVPAMRFRDYLVGDETLRFRNLHASIPEYESRLPGVKIVAAVQRNAGAAGDAGALEAVSMKLDTLWVDMDAESACLVWRGTCPTRDTKFSDLAYAWVGVESLATQLGDADVVLRARAAIAADEAMWEIKEEPPPSPPPPELPPRPAAEEEEDALPADLAAALATLPRTEVSAEEQAQIDAAVRAAETQAPKSFGEDEPSDEPLPWTRERVREAVAAGHSFEGEDLTGVDLTGEDLSGAALGGVILVCAQLGRAKFIGADLTKAALTGASLDSADLTDAKLDEADLSRTAGHKLRACRAKMAGANLAGARWLEVDLAEAVLDGVFAKGGSFDRGIFRGAQLAEANFERASLDQASFEGAKAAGALFVGASLKQATFAGADFKETDFSAANLEDARFDGVDLTDANFEKTIARRARFTGSPIGGLRASDADFGDAIFLRVTGEAPYFERAVMGRVQIAESELPGADFTECDMNEAQITACVFKTAKFVGADLRGAGLLATDCFEALFERARLDDCDGSDSSFYGAEFLDADARRFRGRNRDLTKTKLAGGAP